MCKRFGRILTLSENNVLQVTGHLLQNVSYTLPSKPLKVCIHPWGCQVVVVYHDKLEM